MYKLLKKTILYTITFILLFVLAGAVCYADTPPRSDEEQPIVVYVNDKKTSETAYTYKGNIYIKVTTLQKYGQTDHITFDGPVNLVYVDIANMDILIGDEETTEFLKANSGKLTFHIRYVQKKYNCVSLGVFSQLCKLDYKYENNKLYLYPLAGEYAQDSTAQVRNFYAPLKERDTFSRPINMVWQMGTAPTNFTSSDNRTGYVFNCPLAPAKTENIDVMSPLWLTTENNNKGKVFNNCDYGYIELCHANGMKVWICATNNFAASGGSSYGNTILKTEKYRNKTISQLILYALFYNADGINIDFEGMAHTSSNNVIGNEFNTFIADLYKHCSKVGLTLSIDTMLASSYWSLYYNYKFLGENSDYICPMTYNEHWSLESTGAGSTMSRSYYTTMTNNLLKKVPAEKVLMGVPFFTQVWRVNSSGKAVNVWTVTAKRALELITEHNCTPKWNENDGQYIATYKEYSDGTATGYKMKIWVEDERSMAQKLKYVLSKNIAGTACWAYGQPTKDLLNTFGKVYVHGQNPDTLLGSWPTAAEIEAAQALLGPKYSTGDVNGDETIDANDITDLSRHIAKIAEIEDADMLKACDIDGNGTVDANDLTILSRYVAKIIDSFDDPGITPVDPDPVDPDPPVTDAECFDDNGYWKDINASEYAAVPDLGTIVIKRSEAAAAGDEAGFAALAEAKVLAATQFLKDVPETIAAHRYEVLAAEHADAAFAAGIDMEGYAVSLGYASAAELDQTIRAQAAESAKYALIYQALAEKTSYVPSDADISAYFLKTTGSEYYTAQAEVMGLPCIKNMVICDAMRTLIAGSVTIDENN